MERTPTDLLTQKLNFQTNKNIPDVVTMFLAAMIVFELGVHPDVQAALTSNPTIQRMLRGLAHSSVPNGSEHTGRPDH